MADDPINIQSKWYQQNRRKIFKWVFLLLKEHHERLGLKVVAWSGPEGINTPRLSFFFDGVRQPDGSPQFHFPLNGQTMEMHIYQWAVGVFQPLHGEPQLHPKQSTSDLRTKDMMPWLNKQLRITPLYQSMDSKLLPYTSNDLLWHHAAERYVYSWNVLGLYLKEQPGFIRLETPGSTYDLNDWQQRVTRFLPECRREDMLIFPTHPSDQELFWLHTGRIVRRNGESLDFYQLTKGGMPVEKVVGRVAEFMGDPAQFSEAE